MPTVQRKRPFNLRSRLRLTCRRVFIKIIKSEASYVFTDLSQHVKHLIIGILGELGSLVGRRLTLLQGAKNIYGFIAPFCCTYVGLHMCHCVLDIFKGF
jgi:hypothetical protein|tara:strand:+ start:153 stop:449 length:297 start_codon:yes stop_codon:yes gene_type:complete